ncbi:hypothetical protein GCM10010269_79750 [Streptomyces humidus]|uniref:Uncharacterized protein n=1 Tax=Streptomyces humidus TaxID=52259 RepID=A0A918LCD0_9ACTN|nr:hypothetical protein GCM10010269_79750 [Streptomyces humidus]
MLNDPEAGSAAAAGDAVATSPPQVKAAAARQVRRRRMKGSSCEVGEGQRDRTAGNPLLSPDRAREIKI